MEGSFFSLITTLITSGIIGTDGLVVLVILLLCVLSYYLLRPMFSKMKTMPSKVEIEDMIKAKMVVDDEHVNNLTERLDRLITLMDKLEDIDVNSHREIQELRRDIETIKQILNQFQGHMMYGRSDFGNKELK